MLELFVSEVIFVFQHLMPSYGKKPHSKRETAPLTSPSYSLKAMPPESITKNEFLDATVGMNIPKNFIPAIEKVSPHC